MLIFPASWKLIIGLPAFGFCFDYVRTTSTYLLSDIFYPFYQSLPPSGRNGETEHRAVGAPHQAARQLHPLLYNNNGFSIIRTQIFWATEVGGTFPWLEEGYKGALKEYYKIEADRPVEYADIFAT